MKYTIAFKWETPGSAIVAVSGRQMIVVVL